MRSSEGPEVERLHGERALLAVDVLCDAFAEYPVMRFVLGGSAEEAERRLRTLIGFFVSARLARDEPVLGVLRGGEISAVALVSYPDGSPSTAELSSRARQVWEELGPDAHARYEAFGYASRNFAVDVPHLHLNMIGVRRNRRGLGFGRMLLERVQLLAEENAGCQGITLTTEDPANVRLYEHFGYSVLGKAEVAPGLTTWGMFRPNRV